MKNNENEWVCHHISDSDLKSRKSKVSSLHYSKKKRPAKLEFYPNSVSSQLIPIRAQRPYFLPYNTTRALPAKLFHRLAITNERATECRARAGRKGGAGELWMRWSLAVLAKPLVVCLSSDVRRRKKGIVLLEPLGSFAERAGFFSPWFFSTFVSRQKYNR